MGGGRLSQSSAASWHESAAARHAPLLLPRPQRLHVAPDRRRVRDREPVEAFDPGLAPEGYHLEVADDAVRVRAADDSGLRHARATLAQLRHPANQADAPGTLAACRIEDWPDFAVRGVMIDISRDRVPTLESMKERVDRLAGWKINQIQLYTEHTFAYRGHEEVWRDADPYTAEDVRALDAHCRSRGVELVANQNTLGHFERWLRHERYRPLAITPDGFDWVFGIRRPPLTLDPAKAGSFELVSDLLGQIVPVVASDRVHIGLDEPWELSSDRRGEWVEWLRRLCALPVLDDKELLVWGDVLAIHPDLLGALPGRVTVCEWGYEDNHPFEERAARLASAGVPFWVCPGTSSWLSLSGRFDNMIGNIRTAAAAGRAHGATGLLVTDWGDMGHHQQPTASEAGFAVCAAMGWAAQANGDLDAESVAGLLDVHRFDDPAGETGHAAVRLGQVHRMVTPLPPNMSAFAVHLLLPQWPVGQALTDGLDPADLDRVASVLDDTDDALRRARPAAADGDLATEELRATAALLELSCRDATLRLAGDGTLASVPASDRETLAGSLGDVVEEYRRLWTRRYRPGGLEDSVAWFDHLGDCYRSGSADPSWFGPFG